MPPSTAVAPAEPTAITVRKPPAEALRQLEQVVVEGNLAKLSENERIAYYARVSESLGLNPLTRPFEYITLNGKLTLYARKDATDQLRQIHGVSISRLDRERDEAAGLAIVTAYATDRYGRTDSSIGAVSINGLSGEALANALMKAETKARRRVTLSIVGLGWLDEVEAQDQRSYEVAPRQALNSAIASRTAALTGGASDPGESEASVPTGGAEPEGVREAAPSPPAAPPATKPRARRKATTEPKQAGDEGYWRARTHAVADERGLDPDAVKRIAGDVLGRTGDWSRTELTEGDWEQVGAAIAAAPVTLDDDEISTFTGTAAVEAGIGKGAADPWPAIDKVASDLMGSPASELTPAEWLELGIRWTARA